MFESERFLGILQWQDGCFCQDAVGDWWLCLPARVAIESNVAPEPEVGIDLGLHATATTSDGAVLDAGRAYRDLEQKIATAQRRDHKRQAKRLHRKASRRRAFALHRFSRKMANTYQMIVVGDVSSPKLARTRMAKAVLDSGWGLLRMQLQYKGESAGRCVRIVSERNTSRTCSACGALSGPAGVNGLRVRLWVCGECGCAHDRDVNAAKNILAAGGCPPSVRGNESSPRHAPPSRTPRPRKAGKARDGAAA